MVTMKILIAIPTYNECENILQLYKRITQVLPNCDIVVLDDSSPDGTAEIVREIARSNPRVRLFLRNQKLGIGSAHKEAFRQAIACNADVLVTLDADLTHNPEDIPKLLGALQVADVAVGSRFMKGGGLQDWTPIRRALTHLGHIATKCLLQVPFDATGALRAYQMNSLAVELPEASLHNGYPFLYQSLTWFVRNDSSVAEVPIVLTARAYGSSKMRARDVLFGFLGLFKFALTHRKSFRRYRVSRIGGE
jgi:dolichol-phosphate mannosyltransferase